MKKLKVVFAGTPEFAVPSLKSLLADTAIEVAAVFTQPDRPAGRGEKIVPPSVKVFAKKAGVRVLQPSSLSKSDLEEIKPDFLAVVAYGVILPKNVLALPRFGCVNLHASLLPKFRGASPIASALLAGEKKTGVSFMQISERLDAGPVFAKFETSIGDKNAVEISNELAALGGRKFPEILKKIARGELSSAPQNEAAASFCQKIKKADGEADWRKDSSELLVRKLRAFAPWPGVWTKFRGQNLKLLEFESAPPVGSSPAGTVYAAAGKICVRAAAGAIEIKRVQLAGKKALPIAEFMRGNADFVGAKLGE